jgi:Uma2 family endonuclease
MDVRLSEKTTVQPDVLVILKEHIKQRVDRNNPKRVIGSPDLAVEVISPSSDTYDRLVKYAVYEQAGVPEYWLVDRKAQTIEVFVLENGHYMSLGIFAGEQTIQSRLVPGEPTPASRFFAWSEMFDEE